MGWCGSAPSRLAQPIIFSTPNASWKSITMLCKIMQHCIQCMAIFMFSCVRITNHCSWRDWNCPFNAANACFTWMWTFWGQRLINDIIENCKLLSKDTCCKYFLIAKAQSLLSTWMEQNTTSVLHMHYLPIYSVLSGFCVISIPNNACASCMLPRWPRP